MYSGDCRLQTAVEVMMDHLRERRLKNALPLVGSGKAE